MIYLVTSVKYILWLSGFLTERIQKFYVSIFEDDKYYSADQKKYKKKFHFQLNYLLHKKEICV